MKTLTEFSQRIFSQKGQGLVEYALLFSFVFAIFIISFTKGGFSEAFESLFGRSSDAVESNYSNNTATETESFDYETLTEEDVVAPEYKTLNWQEINMGVQAMYNTVLRSDTADKAIISERNLFGQIMGMTEGYLASTKAEDGTKDWEDFLSMLDKFRSRNDFSSSYKRGEESITFQRLGNSNSFQVRYTDGKEVVYYRLSPDANNVMQVETNSNKSYSEFFQTIVNKGGWEYSK
ncbi:MAG: hypothetical protein IKZ53_00865 [Selenomonadaceae bacterium]|nr:hypothetical protein [Selenomonadaceae bacterium]